jgi:hypothetical protein
MTVNIRSSNDILTQLIAKILADTDLTDVSPGSELSKILEAVADEQYLTGVQALTILQASNLDNLVGKDLDSKANDLSLPDGSGGIGRIPAKRSAGAVTISSSFTKRSTILYPGKPAPFVGTTVIYLQTAEGFSSTGGQIYIGRGTDHEEGPLTYTSVDNTQVRPFYTMTLDANSRITKNHIVGEYVTLAQGGTRVVPAGTTVIAPSVNSSPAVNFTTDVAATLLDGESSISVAATCVAFGTTGNVQANSITQFSSLPFTGATVTNASAFSSGQDIEDDNSLRQRIKDYSFTLSRGTARAIQSALRGLSDPVSGKTVVSTNIIQPTVIGNPSRAYVDDGQGLEPAYAGQSFENLVSNSAGNETLFKTAKSPVLAPIAFGSVSEPYQLTDGQTLVIQLDDIIETFVVNSENYVNVSSALASEVVNDFNSQNNKIRFRASNNSSRVTAFDLNGDGEIMTIQSGYIQSVLGLPVTDIRPLFLYKNNTLLNQKGSTATLLSNNYPWVNLAVSNLISQQVEVDGVTQTITIADSDFTPATIKTATLDQWVTVMTKKVAGAKFTAIYNTDGTSQLRMETRQSSSASGTLRILSTSWAGVGMLWPVSATSIVSGKTSDYSLNRFSGQIQLASNPSSGDSITIGSQKTRAAVYSKSTANSQYSLGTTVYGNPKLIVAADGAFAVRDLSLVPTGAYFTWTTASSIQALKLVFNNIQTLASVEVGDFLYLGGDTSIASANQVPAIVQGLYRIKTVGFNRTATTINLSGSTFTFANNSSVINVTTPTAHGLSTGSGINTSVSSSYPDASKLAGSAISGNFIVTVTGTSTFTFIANATSTGASTGNNPFVSISAPPDAFIICQIDGNSQYYNWNTIPSSTQLQYSAKSLFLFKSMNSFPQIVDLGTSNILTVDQIVSSINSQVSCLTAVKDSPRKLFIRTNSLVKGSSVAVLAAIGSASNIFSTGVSSSIQKHIGSSMSGAVWSGGPKIYGITGNSTYYPTRIANQIGVTFTRIYGTTANPSTENAAGSVYPTGCNNLCIGGNSTGLMLKAYNNSLSAPFTGFVKSVGTIRPLSQNPFNTNQDGESIRMDEAPLGVNDKLVVITDNDATNKTSSIPVSKSAVLMSLSMPTTSGKGKTVSVTLADDEDKSTLYPNGRPFFDSTSVFNTFDLTDIDILFHPTIIHYVYPSLASNYATLPVGNPNAAIVVRSTQWGNAHRVALATYYSPTASKTGVTVSHRLKIDSTALLDNGVSTLQLYAVLPTGAVINGSVFSASTYTIAPSNYPWTAGGPAVVQIVIASININASNLYIAGNYVNIGTGHQYSGTYLITATTANSITAVAPGIRAASYSTITVDASLYPVSSFTATPCTIGDIVDAINNYFPENPVATAQFVTSAPSTVTKSTSYLYPSYYTQGSTTPNNSLSTLGESIDYHSVTSSYGCVINVHTNSNPTALIAISQYVDPPCLTTAQTTNTGYSYLNEPVRLMPASTKSLSNWLNLKAFSSLSGFSNIERCGNDATIQISSQVMGSTGSVQIAGVKANSLTSVVLSNPEQANNYLRTTVAFADAESMPAGSTVLVKNSIGTTINRPFATTQPASSITVSNTADIASWFRPTTRATYSYVDSVTGRFTFSATPLSATTGITITVTPVDTYISKVSSTATLNARVGEMFYVKTISGGALSGYTLASDTSDQYVGVSVVSVESSTAFYVMSNRVNSTYTFTYSNSTDAVFVPMIKTEKNVPTNFYPGVSFRTSATTSMPVTLKNLGNGLMFLSMANPSAGIIGDSGLDKWSVSSDDWIRLESTFSSENRGRFRIAGTDGIRRITFYNPTGSDLIFDTSLNVGNSTTGSSYGNATSWTVPLFNANNTNPVDKRHIRIYDANSVFEGDYLQIVSPDASTTSWFTSDLISKFKITEIGLTVNAELYVNFTMPVANATTQAFDLGINNGTFQFIEGTPYTGIKYVVGSTINSQQSTYADVLMAPSSGFSKISPANGSYITSLYKTNYDTQINRGIDGYTTYSELLSLACTVIDGSPTDAVSYPGVRAAGTAVDVQAPLVRSISMSLTLQATNGVGLSSIKDPVKSTITNYIKGLGVGESVVLSEIIKRVQQIPGVLSVVIDSTTPSANNGIISVSSIEVARIVKDSNIYI